MPATHVPEPLGVEPRTAAKMLGISARSLWSLTAPRGPIPAFKLGRSVRYSVATLRRLIGEWQDQQEAQNP